jgi:hypothetical protein
VSLMMTTSCLATLTVIPALVLIFEPRFLGARTIPAARRG